MPIVSLSTENPFVDGRQSQRALTIRTGVERYFAEAGWATLPELTLPTGRRARFSSGLGVTDFMKRTSFISCHEQALRNIGPAAVALAEAEGLPAHAQSIKKRLEK